MSEFSGLKLREAPHLAMMRQVSLSAGLGNGRDVAELATIAMLRQYLALGAVQTNRHGLGHIRFRDRVLDLVLPGLYNESFVGHDSPAPDVRTVFDRDRGYQQSLRRQLPQGEKREVCLHSNEPHASAIGDGQAAE